MAATAERIGRDRFIGRTVDNLSYRERLQLTGTWVAVELYSPVNLALRIFQAVGESAGKCRRDLRARGLDPANYEYFPLTRPWQ